MQFLAGILTGVLAAFIYYSGMLDELGTKLAVAKDAQEIETVLEQSSIVDHSEITEPVYETVEDLISEIATNDTDPGIPGEQIVTGEPVGPNGEPELVGLDDFSESVETAAELPVFESLPTVSPRFQNAWMSFHSEASATGFAEKMTNQLQRDFFVLKRAPGKYEVGFHYLDVDERTEVLDDIHEVTGYRPLES